MNSKTSLNTWIAAARLRTLPLALSSIILGSLLAVSFSKFSAIVLILSVITATVYQILSNYANDLGDGLKGTDANRVGEKRAIASGSISVAQMRKAVNVFTVLSLVFGTLLSIFSTQQNDIWVTIFFITLGIMATIAARSYTMGKNAYGYAGLGDVFVLLFFGYVGVIGSYFLHGNHFNFLVLLPATSVGFLATGVLNLNNLRDAETDAKSAKKTVVVRLGRKGAKFYQTFLIIGALVFQGLFVVLTSSGAWAWLYLAVAPLLILNLSKTWRASQPAQFDPLLKPLAISTLLFCLLAGLGVIL